MSPTIASVLGANRPGRRAFSPLAWLALGALSLTGCATSTTVKVDSLAKPKAEDAISYEIHNTNPLVADDSLRYKEAAGFVKTALSGRGMYEAPGNTKPDVVVDLDYGIGPPQTRTEMQSEPIYMTIPGEVRTMTVQVGVDRQGNPIYSTVVTQDPPRTEFAGYREYPVTVTVYEKYLRLTARGTEPAAEGRPPEEIWTVDVTSEGESRDLRKNLPVMVAASIDYIGKDSHGQKTIKIKDDSKDVAFVKKGLGTTDATPKPATPSS
ncbi:MAG TPA: hypothetical protein VHD62_14395 [Opitutaceae bacterium]|nr:hypothetical protein [Opitutaceae bacterium]